MYASYSRLNLFSNFTYFLDDPVNGDQFEQTDERAVAGANASREWLAHWFGRDNVVTVGTQLRRDQIFQVGLFRTGDQKRLDTVRDDEVTQTSLGVYVDAETRWNDAFRTVAGLRGDVYHFDVDSSLDANSGDGTDAIASPKLNFILGPWSDTEYYLNLGYGYHSNDARGTTIQVDPASGLAVDPVDPLVRSKGAEVGARTTAIENLNSTLSLWYLELDSVLLFVGDAGATEASRPSERYGVEWANFYRVTEWLTLDLDLAFTEAQFSDDSPDDDEIPGAIDRVLTAGAAINFPNGVFGALRLRHFGPRPLIEDGSVESDSTSLVNIKAGYRFTDRFAVELDVLNVLDSQDDDISYFYASRLPGEPAAGVEDIHFHPVEPLTARVYASWLF